MKLAVYVFFEQQGKLLLLKRTGTGYYDGHYSVPSGHVESGETFEEAAKRETQEEVGLKILELRLIHASRREAAGYVDIYYQALAWYGQAINVEPEKHGKMLWSQDWPNPVDYVKQVWDAYRGIPLV